MPLPPDPATLFEMSETKTSTPSDKKHLIASASPIVITPQEQLLQVMVKSNQGELTWLATGYSYSGSTQYLMSEKICLEAEALGVAKYTRDNQRRESTIFEGTPLRRDVHLLGKCQLKFYVEEQRWRLVSFDVAMDLGKLEIAFGKANHPRRAKL